MKDAAQVNTSKLVSDLKAVIVDTEELLKLTAGQAGDKLTDVRSRLGDRPAWPRAASPSSRKKCLRAARSWPRPPTITSMKIPGGQSVPPPASPSCWGC